MSDSTEESKTECEATDLVKPNCTITPRHDRLLDEMKRTHYASRSEALRSAIEDHDDSLKGDNRHSIEHLKNEVSELQADLNEIDDRIQRIESAIVGREGASEDAASLSVASEITSTSTDQSGLSESESVVYETVRDLGMVSVPEIADRVEYSVDDVDGFVTELLKKNLITANNSSQPRTYRPTNPDW